MRTLFFLAAPLMAAAPLAAQNTHEVVMYHGDSNLNDWGIYRHLDFDGDGVFLGGLELLPFAVDGAVQITFIEDIKFRVDSGTPAIYAIAAGDVVLRMVDADGNGRVDDPGEITTVIDTHAAHGVTNTSPDGLDFDALTGEIYVCDDLWTGAPAPGSGISVYSDSNADGDYLDSGEMTLLVDGTGSQTVLGDQGQQVNIGLTDFESIMFDDTNGIAIGFEQQDLNIYAFMDMNGDGDAMDAGEAWNFCNLVGDVPGLTQNADVVSGVLPNPSCPSSSGTGRYTDFGVLEFAAGAGPNGEDVYWMQTTTSGTCLGSNALVFQGIDLNGDLDLNDAGEVTLYLDGPNSPLSSTPTALFGGAANDGGYTTRQISGDVNFLYDLNGDRDAMDAGEATLMGIDPQGHYIGEIETVPEGAFEKGTPPPPFFLTFGTAGTGSHGLQPQIGNNGTPVIGGSFDVTLSDGLPSTSALLLMGFSDEVWNRPPPLALPFDMGGIGAPGNTLYVSVDHQFQTISTPGGDASITLNVPNNPNFIGRDVYFQWWVSDGQANQRGVTMSNAGHTQVE